MPPCAGTRFTPSVAMLLEASTTARQACPTGSTAGPPPRHLTFVELLWVPECFKRRMDRNFTRVSRNSGKIGAANTSRRVALHTTAMAIPLLGLMTAASGAAATSTLAADTLPCHHWAATRRAALMMKPPPVPETCH